MSPKLLVFFGDTLEINANAEGGSLTVEALDAAGKPDELRASGSTNAR